MTVNLVIHRFWHLVVAAALCLGAFAQVTFADEPELRATAFEMKADQTSGQIAFDLDRKADLNWFTLRAPYRLIVDLPATKFLFEPKALASAGIVREVRFGNVEKGRSRLILTMKKPFKVVELAAKEQGAHPQTRLVANFATTSPEEFDASMIDRSITTSSTVAATISEAKPVSNKFKVVLDAGHGGIDGGATGRHGTTEKTVTLEFVKSLKEKLEKTGLYEVALTREGDEFLRLDERVRIAREQRAGLFISIHADTIRLKGIRGATVYTVSDEASDADAAALADRENLSDQLAGIEIEEQNPVVADVLVDLIRRETHGFSVTFARGLVGNLRKTTGMINNPHRHAGFRVLRAPDVPSVLLELGYLSNAKDEQQLLDPKWRNDTADSVVNAINAFSLGRIAARQ